MWTAPVVFQGGYSGGCSTPHLLNIMPFRVKDGRTYNSARTVAARLARGFGVRNPEAGQSIGMGIGVGIFLVALGAILTFAVDWRVAGLDLDAVGWVLMAAGAVGLVLFFYFWNRRRPTAYHPRQPQPRKPQVRESQVYDSRHPDYRHRHSRDGRVASFRLLWQENDHPIPVGRRQPPSGPGRWR